MAKRSFYVKDSELDDYQVKVINKKTDNSYIVKGLLVAESPFLPCGRQNRYKMSIRVPIFTLCSLKH